MQLFIWGLQKDIAEKVNLTHPTSLAKATAAAEEIELAVRFSRHPAAHAQRANLQKNPNVGTGSRGTGAGRWRGRWYRGRGRGFAQTSGQLRYPNQAFQAGQQSNATPRNVMNLGGNIVCHRCGRQGHIAPNCPQRPTFRGGGQAGRHVGGQRGNGRRGGGVQRMAVMQADAEDMDTPPDHPQESNTDAPPQENYMRLLARAL